MWLNGVDYLNEEIISLKVMQNTDMVLMYQAWHEKHHVQDNS
jgi:hypothetical protein